MKHNVEKTNHENLKLNDFISDYQHLLVSGASKKTIKKHIATYYYTIEKECYNYINRK